MVKHRPNTHFCSQRVFWLSMFFWLFAKIVRLSTKIDFDQSDLPRRRNWPWRRHKDLLQAAKNDPNKTV